MEIIHWSRFHETEPDIELWRSERVGRVRQREGEKGRHSNNIKTLYYIYSTSCYIARKKGKRRVGDSSKCVYRFIDFGFFASAAIQTNFYVKALSEGISARMENFPSCLFPFFLPSPKTIFLSELPYQLPDNWAINQKVSLNKMTTPKVKKTSIMTRVGWAKLSVPVHTIVFNTSSWTLLLRHRAEA